MENSIEFTHNFNTHNSLSLPLRFLPSAERKKLFSPLCKYGVCFINEIFDTKFIIPKRLEKVKHLFHTLYKALFRLYKKCLLCRRLLYPPEHLTALFGFISAHILQYKKREGIKTLSKYYNKLSNSSSSAFDFFFAPDLNPLSSSTFLISAHFLGKNVS